MARKLGSHIDPIYNLKPEYAKGYKWATLDWYPETKEIEVVLWSRWNTSGNSRKRYPEAKLKAVVRLYSAGRRAG